MKLYCLYKKLDIPAILFNAISTGRHKKHPSPSRAILLIKTKWFPLILTLFTLGDFKPFINLWFKYGVIAE